MLSCSASVCSSATDFCFNSAISTGGTPRRIDPPENWLGMEECKGARPGEVGRCMCGWGPKGAETSETCETGSVGPSKKLRKLEGRRNPVKRGAGIAEGPGRYNVSTSRHCGGSSS